MPEAAERCGIVSRWATCIALLAAALALGACATEPGYDDPYGYAYPPYPGGVGYGYYDYGPRSYGYRPYPYHYYPYGPIRRDPSPAPPPQRQREKQSDQPSRYLERGRDQPSATMKVQPQRKPSQGDDDKKRP